MEILKSTGLTKKFGPKTAVDRIDLSLEEGHIYAMLGPNGSGKTTWMKMAAGLVKPTSGKVEFRGDPVGVNSRRHIAYMSTEPYFYNWMTLRDAGKYYKDFFEDFSEDGYRRLLEQLELDEKQKISSLSSGLTAKMKLAITLSRNAEVWMLDEPFNGIDLMARDEMRGVILNSMSDSKKLMLISSHLVEELETVADRAIFISEGRLAEVRDLEEMREKDGLSMADRYRQIYGHTEE